MKDEFAANDTAYEQCKPVAGAAIELVTHQRNVALRALTLIHEMAKKRSRVNMQDGTSLEAFCGFAIREVNAQADCADPWHDNPTGQSGWKCPTCKR